MGGGDHLMLQMLMEWPDRLQSRGTDTKEGWQKCRIWVEEGADVLLLGFWRVPSPSRVPKAHQ